MGCSPPMCVGPGPDPPSTDPGPLAGAQVDQGESGAAEWIPCVLDGPWGGQGRGSGLQGDWPGRTCLLVSMEKLPRSARADPSTCPHPASLPSSMGVSLSFLLHWDPLLPVSRKPTKGKRCWSEWSSACPALVQQLSFGGGSSHSELPPTSPPCSLMEEER